jgi:sugar transferase (PEP-CTERM system associated)
MSTLALALLEGAMLFAGVSGVTALWGVPGEAGGAPSATATAVQASVFAGCCLVAFYYNDLYDLRVVRDFPAFAVRLVQAIGVAFILMAVFYAFLPEARVTWGVFIGTVLLVVGLVVPARAAFYAVLRRRAFAQRVLVIGTGGLAAELVRLIEETPESGQRVVAVVSDNGGGEEGFGRSPVVGPIERLGKIIEEHRPERVVVAMRERRGRLPVRDLLEAQAAGLVVEDGVDLYERLTGKIAIENLTPSQLIFSPAFHISRRRRLVRRLVSLAVAAVGLAVTGPLMVAIAAAIRLDSPGPVFFRQQRCGRGGRLFWLVKFRTMREAPAGPASVWERDDTGRVTRVGRWLRRTRLDELPQFWNILKGDMALVGPRPEMAANVEAMTEQIPYYSLRHRVEPGVTGWAQVRQGYAVTLPEVTEKIRYDLYYVKHMSVWFDLRVLLDTVKIVLFGRGAR